ncbi:MAG: hypothetical protein RMN51_09090 [Verrucomicrobiota bacterium]|nr:hypothetical protein [Limisphaera sp.]MDW8382245.1 hypothetical protein [Verrucomicrobiota bacterium]
MRMQVRGLFVVTTLLLTGSALAVVCYTTVTDTTCKKLGSIEYFSRCAWRQFLSAAGGFSRCDEAPTGLLNCKDVGNAKECWYQYLYHECNGQEVVLWGTNYIKDSVATGGVCPPP